LNYFLPGFDGPPEIDKSCGKSLVLEAVPVYLVEAFLATEQFWLYFVLIEESAGSCGFLMWEVGERCPWLCCRALYVDFTLPPKPRAAAPVCLRASFFVAFFVSFGACRRALGSATEAIWKTWHCCEPPGSATGTGARVPFISSPKRLARDWARKRERLSGAPFCAPLGVRVRGLGRYMRP